LPRRIRELCSHPEGPLHYYGIVIPCCWNRDFAMTTKPIGQFSFVDALLPSARIGRLDRLSGPVKWYRFEKILSRLRQPNTPGRPAYSVPMMFKALLLQSLYGLSDSELEEALADRLSFRRFEGLALDEAVPDHTTLNRFRNLLIEAGLLEKLFSELDRQLGRCWTPR
jgi:transposase, IS5 family